MKCTQRQESFIALAGLTIILSCFFLFIYFNGGSSNIPLYINPTTFLTSHLFVLFQTIFDYFPPQGDVEALWRVSRLQNYLWTIVSMAWFLAISVIVLRVIRYSYPAPLVVISGCWIVIVIVSFVRGMTNIGML